MGLLESVREIEDFRRKEGRRYDLEQMFGMLLISGLCGHFGGRAVERFTELHSDSFTEHLQLRHEPPSHVSFSTFLNNVPQESMIEAFHNWTSTYVPLEEGIRMSGDGKALKSTSRDRKGKSFEAVVSLFAHESGLTRSIGIYQNDKASEIHVFQHLIEYLKDLGLVFFLDSVHCQKKL